ISHKALIFLLLRFVIPVDSDPVPVRSWVEYSTKSDNPMTRRGSWKSGGVVAPGGDQDRRVGTGRVSATHEGNPAGIGWVGCPDFVGRPTVTGGRIVTIDMRWGYQENMLAPKGVSPIEAGGPLSRCCSVEELRPRPPGSPRRGLPQSIPPPEPGPATGSD